MLRPAGQLLLLLLVSAEALGALRVLAADEGVPDDSHPFRALPAKGQQQLRALRQRREGGRRRGERRHQRLPGEQEPWGAEQQRAWATQLSQELLDEAQPQQSAAAGILGQQRRQQQLAASESEPQQSDARQQQQPDPVLPAGELEEEAGAVAAHMSKVLAETVAGALQPGQASEAEEAMLLEELTGLLLEERGLAGPGGAPLDAAALRAELGGLFGPGGPDDARAAAARLRAAGIVASSSHYWQQEQPQPAEPRRAKKAWTQPKRWVRPPEVASVYADAGVVGELAKTAQEALLAFAAAPEAQQPGAAARQPPLQAAAGEAAADESSADEALWAVRQRAVTQAAQETWAAYETHAFGRDELLPLSLAGADSSGGIGLQLLEALDTLWLLGLREEFDRAVAWVADSLDVAACCREPLPTAEVLTRAVGGLLSAYDLSGEAPLLRAAAALGAALLPAFQGGALPAPNVLLGDPKQPQQPEAHLGSFGVLGPELHVLATRTGGLELKALAQLPYRALAEHYPHQGLLPARFNRSTARIANVTLGFQAELSLAGGAGGYHASLLRLWLLTGEESLRAAWQRGMDAAQRRLVRQGPGGEPLPRAWAGGRWQAGITHEACGLPGSLALGAAAGAVTGEKAEAFLATATDLADACWRLCGGTSTGLAGEGANCTGPNRLQPALAHSLWLLWRVTGDEAHRRRGWEAFEAWREHARTRQGAFAAIEDVDSTAPEQTDEMPTAWLGGTLKFLWLLFGDGGGPATDLGAWVFSSAGHPHRIAAAPVVAAAPAIAASAETS